MNEHHYVRAYEAEFSKKAALRSAAQAADKV